MAINKQSLTFCTTEDFNLYKHIQHFHKCLPIAVMTTRTSRFSSPYAITHAWHTYNC